jgi:hypothetical protein
VLPAVVGVEAEDAGSVARADEGGGGGVADGVAVPVGRGGRGVANGFEVAVFDEVADGVGGDEVEGEVFSDSVAVRA